jgi:Ca2+-binding RTX toxin-like protein
MSPEPRRYNLGGVTGVQVDLAAQTATGVWSGVAFTDTLISVEFIRGSDFADVIKGSAADERLSGHGGADVIDGRFGADLLWGGGGIDLVRMGGADDDSADGAADSVAGTLSDLNGDTIMQIGAEDRIFVEGATLTDAQVRLIGNTLSIDGDGDGTFETAMTVYGPGLVNAAPVVRYTDRAGAPGTTDTFSGTRISFASADRELQIDQLAQGAFATNLMSAFSNAINGVKTVETASLVVFAYDDPGYGPIEMRLTGSGLAGSATPWAPYVTGLEFVVDGVTALTFSGLSEPGGDVGDALRAFAAGDRTAFNAMLGRYTVTWDASAATGAVTWDGPATPLGVTLIGSANSGDQLDAHDGDTVIAGTNTGSDEISFTGGDILADLSAAATQPLSYYTLDFRYDADGARLNQGVVATFGPTTGTVEYGNSGDRGTATIIGLDAIDVLGGISLFTARANDVVSVQSDADTFYAFTTQGGDNTYTGGIQDDRYSVRVAGGVTYRIDGYGEGGAYGTSDDRIGGVSTFSAVDSLRGFSGNDSFFGGVGDDYFITEAGNDYVDGGDGFDLVRYNRSGVTGVQVDLSARTATGVWSGAAFTDTLINVEFIVGSDFADVIERSAADEVLSGQNGDDIVDGRFGADLLTGGGGVDLIRMGGADDDSADGDADVASGLLSRLNGDKIMQVGAEDKIFVVNATLTDAQVHLTGDILSIDGDGDDTFETAMTVSGPGLVGAAPVLTLVEGVAVPSSPELYSGTMISFVAEERNLLIEQFASGLFAYHLMSAFSEAINGATTVETSTLIVLTLDVSSYGPIEMRVTGFGLAHAADTWSGQVTGLEFVVDGVSAMTLAGLSETFGDLAAALAAHAIDDRTAFNTLLGRYALT